MELRHLRYFLAVSETGSFTRAAEQEYVAQSALSEQIARLEAEVGVPLFHRTTRHVSLTPAGEILRPLVVQILADVDHAQNEMAALAGIRKGRLRFGIIQSSAGLVDLVELLRDYRRQFPMIKLQVRSGASAEMAQAVLHGELDLAIVALPSPDLPSVLAYKSIVDDPLVAVLSHEAARGAVDPIALDELAQRGPFIHFLPGSGLRTAVTRAFERAGLSLVGEFELGQMSDMIRLAAAGLGVTVVPASSAEHALADLGPEARFAILRLVDETAVHPVGVVYDARRLSPAASALLASLPIDR